MPWLHFRNQGFFLHITHKNTTQKTLSLTSLGFDFQYNMVFLRFFAVRFVTEILYPKNQKPQKIKVFSRVTFFSCQKITS